MRENMLMKFKTGSFNSFYNVQLLMIMVVASTLLGGLLFYFILHKPLTAAAEDYARQAAAHTQEITAVTNFQNAHLQMKEYRAELKKREQRVWQYLPEHMGQGEFMLYLERLALHNQMELQMVNPQKNISAEDNQCLPIKIRIVGRYFGLLKFLQGLQDGERLAVVKKMSIVSKGDTLECDMLIHIYAVPAK